MIIVCIIKMIVNMQFLLSLEMFKIMDIELAHDQVRMNQEHMDLSFVYVMVVILRINHGFVMWADHFKSIQGVTDVYKNWA